jgi:putative serine protease PepD
VNCSDEYVNRSPSTSVAGSGTNASPTSTSIGATTSLPTVVASPAGSTSVAAPVTTVASQIPAATSATTIQTATQTTVTRRAATSLAPATAGREPATRADAQRTQSGSTVDSAGAAASTTISAGASGASGAAASASSTTIVDDIASVTSTDLDKSEATSSPSTASTVVWPQGDAAAAGSQMRGVHVHDVVRASPADKGGVRRGDVILAADGRPVRTVWALVLAIRRHAVGDEINVLVRRDGSLVTLPMVLANRPDGST